MIYSFYVEIDVHPLSSDELDAVTTALTQAADTALDGRATMITVGVDGDA